LPLLSVPFLRLCMARFTSLPALREYLAIVSSWLIRDPHNITDLAMNSCGGAQMRSTRAAKQPRFA
jgi:hypothetical protein